MIRGRSRLRKTEHEYVDKRLSAYVDDELAIRQRTRVEAHLRMCESCRNDLRALRWTKGLLQQAPAVRLPRSFVVREVDVTSRQPVRRRRPVFAVQWATAVVALLFVLVLAGDVLTGARLAGGMERPASELAYEQPGVAQEYVEAEKVVTVIVEKKVEIQKEQALTEPEEEQRKAQTAPPPGAEKQVEVETREGEADQMGATRAITDTPAAAAVAESEGLRVAPTPSPAAVEPATGGEAKEEPLPIEPRPTEPPSPTTLPEHEDGRRPRQGGSLVSVNWVRIAWRVAEIGLGIALVGLLIALVWARRRT